MNNRLFRKIPILITKWDDNDVKGWRAEISDKYENFKPTRYEAINFEDLNHHFYCPGEVHERDGLVFKLRKDAVEAAQWVIKEKLGGNGKIWF